ncbi:MAG: glycoside hydrolase family 2 protein [Candidatus Helarchaeota archaeon]
MLDEKPPWKPIDGHIMTRWAKKVNYNDPLPEYPRPQMKRNDWLNLNGLWDFAITSKKKGKPNSFNEKILVPFPVESALSGIKRPVKGNQFIWYRCYFSIPDSWEDKKILLHFGAVDWEATVYINGKEVGVHQGGYTPFSFEISEYLNMMEDNELLVRVWDSTKYERGKQSLRPFLIYYTAVSGIWQTVWLEPVPKTFIETFQMDPDIEKEYLKVIVKINDGKSTDKVQIIAKEKSNEINSTSGNIEDPLILKIPDPKLWSHKTPFLYDLTIQLKRNDEILDEVLSYCGMRKISVGKDSDGITRINLNNEPIFQYGTLDQGYWPDGLYTAPTDEALLYDIEITKEFGFNMIRKHVKVEPLRWYYYCDKLGMLVWQDMPNGGKLIFGRRKNKIKQYYYNELKSMISTLYNSPSIIVWVPFNEGWGQFDTKNVVKLIRNQDPKRLIDHASGWFDKGIGDIRDIHVYPGPYQRKYLIKKRRLPDNLKGRAAVIGEFGGFGLEINDHVWKSRLKFAYKKYKNADILTENYVELITKLRPLIKEGLCAAVYTQITDVEMEINGLLTYDREIIKIDKKKLKELNLSLFK